jgi:dipeptidyl aminopeptidase/acylaminoacyl peptidase
MLSEGAHSSSVALIPYKNSERLLFPDINHMQDVTGATRAFRNCAPTLKSILRDSQTGSLDNAVTKINLSAIKTTDAGMRKSRRWAVWLILPILILALAGGVYWKYFHVQNSVLTTFQTIKLDVLTAHGLARSVAISPDGKYFAYAKDENGKQSLWLRQTASAGDTQMVPPEGKFRIWKTPLKGGDPVKLTDIESITPAISRDGKSVAYFITEKGSPLKLGIISIDGGTPLKTLDLPATTNSDAGLAWNKTGNGILFVNRLGTTSNIWTQPLDRAKPTPLTTFKEFQIAKFALNSEGNRLAISRGSRNRDIVLIKNIRK